jgi:hypothetical protein
MEKRTVLALYLGILLLALVGTTHAADGSPVEQFVGSPLIVLVFFFIIDLIAFVYHKVRK